MPIYEYKCTICQERFEVEQSIKDETLTVIAGDDHEHTVKKVFHPVGIAFKGEGFYKNDTRSTTSSSSGSGSTSSDSSSTGSDSGSSSAGTAASASSTSSSSD